MLRRIFGFLCVVFTAVSGGCESKPPSPDPQAVAPTRSQEDPPDLGHTLTDAADVPANAALSGKAEDGDLPQVLLSLFEELEELGLPNVADARFVKVTLHRYEEDGEGFLQEAFLLRDDEKTVTLLKDDLIGWQYQKEGTTTVPSTWKPGTVKLGKIEEADFEEKLKKLLAPQEPEDEGARFFKKLYRPGPSQHFLLAYAAARKGLSQYCQRIAALDPVFQEGAAAYRKAVLEDLAWLHFLRGVNLLMFAERKEVLPHLRLVAKLSPEGEYADDAKDLVQRLETLIAGGRAQPVNEDELSDTERAELYVSRLKDIHCVQVAQPGHIDVYFVFVDGQPDEEGPTKRLLDLGMAAVPALIRALEDDTPTRTVYHWRDFDRHRTVWRVSDFAWSILRDITKLDLQSQRVVGFAYQANSPDQRKVIIEDIEAWYAKNGQLSEDDRMFTLFENQNSDDWTTAGRYFLEKKNPRAVAPLLEKIPQSRDFDRGKLCVLISKFGDASALPAIREVLTNSQEASDQINAAIGLWNLGDESGVPLAIEYVSAITQPYGSWDDPIWFLMRSHTKEGLEALTEVLLKAPRERAGEVLTQIQRGLSGDLWGKTREPAACMEICPVLIAAMDRADFSGGSVNDVRQRCKDRAALCLAMMKQGWKEEFSTRIDMEIDSAVFNEFEPNETLRDEQIEALKKWYLDNREKLTWDTEEMKLVIKED